MTIDELHDYCRYLFDENHVHGVPDKWSEGYEFALSLVMFKCHGGLTDEDRKAVADWREKHWKDTKRAGLIPPTRTVCTFSASNPTMPEKCTD
nr:MAG: hypothetical protein [Bacteriophage sp.]